MNDHGSRPADSRHLMPRWVEDRDRDRDHLVAIIDVAHETGNTIRTVDQLPSVTDLRGIPMFPEHGGIPGAVSGTRPGTDGHLEAVDRRRRIA